MEDTGFQFLSAKTLKGGSVNLYAGKKFTYVTVYRAGGSAVKEMCRTFKSRAAGRVYMNTLKSVHQ